MKTLFKKFDASNALDRGDTPRKPGEPGEVRRFEESLHAMDCHLRESCADDDVPPGLHASVMRAVRTLNMESEPAPSTFLARRLAVAALVLAVGVGVFWSLNQVNVGVTDGASSTSTPPSFAAAFEQGHELTQAAPNAVLGPLSGEWELLNGDFQNALNFVAASVP